MQLPRGATLWWSRYQTRKNEILSTYWLETQILLAWKPLKNFMCLKVFSKLGHCSSLYHGGYSFSDVLKWLIVSLVFYSKDNDVLLLLLLFTWSIKCLSCTSSSLRSLLWRWAFNLVKNSFCLLMSVAKIKEPSCCSISCLHPQEWKRKHTHKANPFEQSDWFCDHQVACFLISASDTVDSRVLVPCSPSVILSPTITLSLDGRYAKDWTEWLKPWVNKESCGSLYIPTVPMSGKIGSQQEMYAWRRSQRLTESQAFGLCIL